MNMLTVGEVLKPQGIRGEVKVKPFTDTPQTFSAFKRVFLDGEEYKVLSVRTGDGCVFLGLRGVPDRNAAELLRGKKVLLPREEAPALPEGSYYIADLLGSAVVTEEGEPLGTLTDITQAACDVYTLDMGGRNVLFPAAKGVIAEVDAEGKKIVVNRKRFEEVAVL